MKVNTSVKKSFFLPVLFLFMAGILFCTPSHVSAAASVPLKNLNAISSGYYITDYSPTFRDSHGKDWKNGVSIDGSMKGYCEFNLNKKYGIFSGVLTAGEITGSGVNLKIEIYLDNVLKYTKEIQKDTPAQNFSVSVFGVKNMTLKVTNSGAFPNGFLFIANGKLTKVTGATLDKTSLSLAMGKTEKLKVWGTSKKVTWKSSNKKVASVDAKGKVTAVYPGTANITATVGGKKFTCKVTVKTPNVKAKALSFKAVGGGMFIRNLSSAKVSFKMPKDAANVKVSIRSSSGSAVYTQEYKTCKKNTTFSFTWDGKGKNGKAVKAGSYTAEVKAGNTVATSDVLTIRDNEFAGGDGSKKNPFLVSTLRQFLSVEKYNGCSFRQTADIDGELETIKGMFSEDTPFTGVYDGKGHSLKNLFLQDDSKDVLALFAGVGETGEVKNVVLDHVNILAKSFGTMLVYKNSGKVTGCRITNCNANMQNNRGAFLVYHNASTGLVSGCEVSSCTMNNTGRGGPVVLNILLSENFGKVLDCKADHVTASSTFGEPMNADFVTVYASGVCGQNEGTIINCSVTDSKVSTSGYNRGSPRYVAGVCAVNKGYISKCWFIGSVTNDGSECTSGVALQQGTYLE